MTIISKHFDTRLGQNIEAYDKKAKKQEKLNSSLPKTEKITSLEEKLSNTLLEYFFPNTEFSFGHGDEFTTIDELKNHPDDHKLLISSKSRYLYADESAFEIVDEIFPDRKDRGAYGSILLGECNKGKDSPPPLSGKLNILIVDDETGDNGAVIDKEQAYKLTGDCYGQISDEKYREITGHKDGDKYRIIQHRFGWKPQEADYKYRFGKGTLRPMNFDDIQYETAKENSKIDLIIPISSLKGTDKQRPGGPLKPQIKPGLYKLDMWLGEKSLSQQGKTATSQVWASFPEGQKDALEKSDADAYKLYIDSKDPRKLAQLYCEKYEKRKEFDQERLQKEEELAASGKSSTISKEDLTPDDNQDGDEKTEVEDLMMYRLIKADLASGHGQLLETEKVKRELEKFVVKEYKDIATFKNITFDRAMIIPSKDLKNGEICIPGQIAEKTEVLNFRAPFLNSNGMCVSEQKHTDDILGPDGNVIEGVICVSDETTERIYDRITQQIKTAFAQVDNEEILNSFKPFIENDITSINDIKFKDIGDLENMQRVNFVDTLNEQITNLQNLGFEVETLPRESEQERQGRDYDGDCVGFTLAENFPNLTAEAIERNKPENAYLPTIKEGKKSFYINDTTEQPEFEAIALQMSDGISVGVINNHLTALEALESEIEIIRNSGDRNLISDYVKTLTSNYSEVLEKDNKQENPSKKIPEAHRDYMERITELTDATNSPEVVNKIFDLNRDFYRRLNEEASYQNQIAVDLFKSNRVPDTDAIKRNSSYLHRNVNYIRDKKQPGIYETKVVETTGYSPTEINIRRVNRHFAKHKLESRPISQFQNLFKEVEFSYQQKAEATLAKRNFDKYFNEAAELQKRQKIDEGQSVSVRTRSGLNFEITNVVRTSNFPKLKEALEQDKAFKIEVKESKNKAKPHKYEVYAQFDNEKTASGYPKYQKFGTVMRDDEHIFKDSLPKNIDTKVNEFKAAISDAQIKIKFDKALESALSFRSSIPDNQIEQYAAATWAISTKKDTSDTELGFNKSASFAFNAFTNEIIDKVETLQFDSFTISNLKEAELQSSEIDFNTPQEIRFSAAAIDKDGNTEIKNVIQLKTPDGEYKEIGDISPTDGRLPLGTTASATIDNGNLSTATLTIDNVSVKVNELNKYNTKINSDEAIEVLIQEGASYSDGETKIFIGNDYLGKLRPESHEEAVKNNWLQNNQSLQLKLDSIVDKGKHPYAIATTEDGNKLYVNIEDQYKLIDGEMQAIPNKFKKYNFDAEQIQARPVVKKTGQKIIAYVNDKPIGTISQEDFKKIEPTGASLIPKPAKIEGNVTTLKVSLDKETIQYPELWVKEREEVTGNESIAINTSEESYQVDEISSKLYQKITTRQAIAFEDTVDNYTNTINLAVDERQLEATEKYLNKNNVEFRVAEKEERIFESTKGMRVIAIDKESLNEKLLETILRRTGGIKSDKIEVPEIPIFSEESAYYFDPKANYGDNEYPAIGLTVPTADSNIVNQFFDKYNLEVSGFNDGNISYFSVIDIENFSYEQYNELYPASEKQFTEYKQNLINLKQDLSSHLGNPLDLSDENNFNTFNQKVEAIQEKLNNGYSTLERNRNIATEYQKTLQKLPERPNIEGYVEPSAPDVSIVKKRKEARAILRIGSAYNPQTQESGASAILVSNNGKNQIAQAANYYPSEKGDLKPAYQTLIQGLIEAKDRGYKAVRIETSNNNLYQRLKGNPQYMHFNGKNKECEPLHKQAMELAKSFEWGINSKFTNYKKYPTAEQANQVASNAIATKNSVNFSKSEPQQSPPSIPNQTQQVTPVLLTTPNQTQQVAPVPSTTPKQTVNSSQSPPPKQQAANKKRKGLTEGQKEALSKMIEFSKQPRTDKDNNEFLLKGYAGTGKTFVIQQFLKEVRKSGENPRIAFTAPTNNAVKVLKEMADKQGIAEFDAKTTHKLLGLKKNINKMSGEVEFTRKKNSQRPELKYDYIVVDEASMLNKSLYENCKEASQAGVKIIYMGDEAQLPPVNESESMVFSQVTNRSELTEVVRYDGDMAHIAEDIRNNLDSKNPTPIQNSQDGTVIALSKEGFKSKVKELFTSDEFKKDNSSVKVIAYTNNRVDEINKFVKDTLYGENAPEYLPGMRIIARNPVKGEFGTALDTSEEMTITKADKSKAGNLDIWILQGINESGEYVKFETLDDRSKPIFKQELDNLRQEIYNKPEIERDWSEYYDLAEKFGNVRPAYAITVHNSQGKTIPQGIVDQNNLDLRLQMAVKEEDTQKRTRGIKEFNQLRYVAMTRFQNAVYVNTGQREQEINRSQTKNSQQAPISLQRTLNITFDGASRNNGKPDAQASAAAVLINPEGKTKEFSEYLGNKTNNEAEFQAAIIGMKAAKEFNYKSIKLEGDSQLVVEALQGKRNIKAENLKPLYLEAKSLLQSFDKAEISYIPREQNKAADALANKTLDNTVKQVNSIDNTQAISGAVEAQNPNKISKITTIGQFGADLGALEAAKNKGIKTDGVAPNGYFTEKGTAPDLLQSYGLKEGEKGKGFGQIYKNAYSANIRSTDATVLVGRILNRNENTDKDLLEIINRYNKPYLVIPKEEVLSNPQAVGEKIAQFATQSNAQSLNIIGERESHAPGIQNAVREAIGKTLEMNKREGVREGESEGEREGVREGEREREEYISNKVKTPKKENVTEPQTKQTSFKSAPVPTQTKSQPTQNIGTTISAYSKDGLGAALSSETKLASDLGNLQNNYPVSYQDNKELPPGTYGGENYPEIKPKGQPFASANQAYHAYQQPSEQTTQKIARMTEILKAKLEQHPRLVEAIAKRGGVQFLSNSTHISSSQDKFWDGKGKESRFIQALSTAYTATIGKDKASPENTDPVAQSLQKWAEDAKFLNRNYVKTINQIQNIYALSKKPLTENHLKTIDKDSKEAEITTEVKSLVTRLTNTLVEDTREDGSKLVQGKKYILESNENTGFTRITNTSNADILLSIENNQVKANNLNNDVYQSLKSAVQAVDEKIKSAQEVTGYNNNKSVNNTTDKNQVTK